MFNVSLEEAKARFSQLEFKGKKLIADLYGRAKFSYLAEIEEGHIHLKGWLKMNQKEYGLEEIDLLVQGPPAGFIKGQFLYFIGTDVTFRELTDLPRTITLSELEELKKDCFDADVELLILGDLPKASKKPGRLVLQDLYGVTAFVAEGEVDEVLMTDYRKKGLDLVCPSDKVFESLEFLKENGWTIENRAGKEVVPLQDFELDWETKEDLIYLKGKGSFGDESVTLDKLLKDRTLSLPSGKVGLLPANFKLFKLNTLIFPKNRFGELAELTGEQVMKKERGDFVPLTEKLPSKDFKGTLRPYQQEGLNWLWFLYQNGFSGLLADEMGLGKTVQTLAFISLLPKTSEILIIQPTSLLFNWLSEIRKFLPERENTIRLISYARLRLDKELLKMGNWEAILLDEAQAIKNSDSQTFKAACSLPAKFKLSLTGTPIENKLSEMNAQFKFLMPNLELSDDPSLLRKRSAPFILRRSKDQVLKDLPPLIQETVVIELSAEQIQAYNHFLADAKRGDLANKSSLEILEVILRLRQIACHPLLAGIEGVASSKMEALMDDIEILLSEKKKIIVFSQFTSMLKLIKKELLERGINTLYLDGDTKDRETPLSQFQINSEELLILMSLKAGGVGLNLTAADWVLLYDPWWNSAVEQQAIARAHRMGRVGTVFTKSYVAKDTIEEKIEILKQTKKNLANVILKEYPSHEVEFNENDWLKLLEI